MRLGRSNRLDLSIILRETVSTIALSLPFSTCYKLHKSAFNQRLEHGYVNSAPAAGTTASSASCMLWCIIDHTHGPAHLKHTSEYLHMLKTKSYQRSESGSPITVVVCTECRESVDKTLLKADKGWFPHRPDCSLYQKPDTGQATPTDHR